MDEENNGTPDASVQEMENEVAPDTTSEELAELKKKANLADNYKIRAEKAETKLKESNKEAPKEEVAPKEDSSLSQKDVITLAKADIHNDDMDEVIDYAKSKNISISEAMESNMIKAYLSTEAEHRKSAESTSTGGGQRGQERETPEATYNKAQQGNLPDESDDKGIERLVDGEWDAQSRKANRNR